MSRGRIQLLAWALLMLVVSVWTYRWEHARLHHHGSHHTHEGVPEKEEEGCELCKWQISACLPSHQVVWKPLPVYGHSFCQVHPEDGVSRILLFLRDDRGPPAGVC